MQDKVERTLLLTAIGIVILVSLADLFGLLDQFVWITKRIPTLILLLLASTIGYWLSEQKQKHQQLKHIEQLVALSSIDATAINSTKQAMDYLANRFTEAKHVYQAAIAPSLSPERFYDKYDQTLRRVLQKKDEFKYRHVILLDKTRWKRAKSFLEDSKIEDYHVCYYDLPGGTLPSLSYAIIDDSEVVVRYPYDPEQKEFWLSIKHPEVVGLFVAYYRRLWSQGTNLKKTDRDAINEIDIKYGDKKTNPDKST